MWQPCIESDRPVPPGKTWRRAFVFACIGPRALIRETRAVWVNGPRRELRYRKAVAPAGAAALAIPSLIVMVVVMMMMMVIAGQVPRPVAVEIDVDAGGGIDGSRHDNLRHPDALADGDVLADQRVPAIPRARYPVGGGITGRKTKGQQDGDNGADDKLSHGSLLVPILFPSLEEQARSQNLRAGKEPACPHPSVAACTAAVF